MERRFGQMRKGREEEYAMLLFPMESNLLKIHRKHPDSNSRRLREAAYLALHRVEGYLSGTQADVNDFESEENIRLRDAMLMVFDPYTNKDVEAALFSEEALSRDDKEAIEHYFQEPVMCIMRIMDSVDMWEKNSGSDGYFDFLEDWLGDQIPNDDYKMNYAVKMAAIDMQKPEDLFK